MARTAGKRQEPRGKLETPRQPSARRKLPTVEDQAPQRMNPKVLMGIGGALVLVLFIVAVAVGLSNETPIEDTMPQDVAVELDGEFLPPFDPTAAADPALGQPAPDVSSVTFDGSPISLTYDGTPTMVLFLAHWCPNCQAEVPELQSYIDANGLPDGVNFVSVATSNTPARTNYPPSLWLDREGWTAPVLVDDAANTIGNAYGLTAFPYYVFVDGEGQVAGRITGQQPAETIVAFMEELAAG
jgi:thiol-disulfide isomerase/thioredoxin